MMIGCVIVDWYGGQCYFGGDYIDIGPGGAGAAEFEPIEQTVRFIRTTRKTRSF
jgi:hypothetical protein